MIYELGQSPAFIVNSICFEQKHIKLENITQSWQRFRHISYAVTLLWGNGYSCVKYHFELSWAKHLNMDGKNLTCKYASLVARKNALVLSTIFVY